MICIIYKMYKSEFALKIDEVGSKNYFTSEEPLDFETPTERFAHCVASICYIRIPNADVQITSQDYRKVPKAGTFLL